MVKSNALTNILFCMLTHCGLVVSQNLFNMCQVTAEQDLI